MMIQMSCMGVIERDGMDDTHYLWAYDRSDVERRGMDAYSRFRRMILDVIAQVVKSWTMMPHK
jgi:hypothetical protein